jgi:ferredoxin
MIRSITKQKPLEEVEKLLEGVEGIFIIGCGTCTTMCHTGGQPEVQEMEEKLRQKGKVVTGSMVIPVACDELTHEAIEEHKNAIEPAQALLIMTCAFGVQTVSTNLKKVVIPALDTLFIGLERGLGMFNEVCNQCGECILADTGGICPVAACHKGLVNGPCGGTNKGKCEIDPDKDCAWTLIYERLKQQGKLEKMLKYHAPKNFQVEPKPGKIFIPHDERSEEDGT